MNKANCSLTRHVLNYQQTADLDCLPLLQSASYIWYSVHLMDALLPLRIVCKSRLCNLQHDRFCKCLLAL